MVKSIYIKRQLSLEQQNHYQQFQEQFPSIQTIPTLNNSKPQQQPHSPSKPIPFTLLPQPTVKTTHHLSKNVPLQPSPLPILQRPRTQTPLPLPHQDRTRKCDDRSAAACQYPTSLRLPRRPNGISASRLGDATSGATPMRSKPFVRTWLWTRLRPWTQM